MKKALLLLLSGICSAQLYAQVEIGVPAEATPKPGYVPFSNAQMKTTALGDTLFFGTQAIFGSGTNYNYNYFGPADSGFVYGTNAVNWKGAARLYDFSGSSNADTGFNIIGVVARFTGKVSASNAMNFVIGVWPQSTAKVNYKTKYFLYGMPSGAPTASVTVPAKNVSLTARSTVYFPSTSVIVNNKNDMYVGYTLDYTWGSTALANDTVGLQRIADANQAGPNYYTVESASKDTLLAPNVIISEGGSWKSLLYQKGITNGGDPIIYPAIRFNCGNCFPSSISKLANNGFSLTNLYPNPAVNNVNVQFGLKDAADVTIAIVDINGRTVKTIENKNMNAGSHTVKVETAELAAGNYLLAVETSLGGALAIQFTVAK